MSDFRVLFVDEGTSNLTEAIERRGFTVEVLSTCDSIFDTLDENIDGIVVNGGTDIELVSQIRDRLGVVPVFFLVDDETAVEPSSSEKGAISVERPESSGAVNALATRIERAVEFSQWASTARDSDSLYRTVVEQSHDAIFIAQDGGFRFWNRRMTELTGLSDDELAEIPLLDIIHPDDRDKVTEISEQRRQGGDAPVSYDVRLVDADGEIHECSANVKDIEYHGSYGVLVTMRDVTERRATEAQFRALVELARDIVTLVGSDGRIKYESPSVEDVLGFDQDELVGAHISDYTHPEDWERVEEAMQRSLQSGEDKKEPIRYRHQDADGNWRWLESVGTNQTDTSVGGFVITTRDVTEQRTYEERLQRHESIVESIRQGAYVVDREAIIQYVNEAAVARISIPREKFIGQHISVAREVDLLNDDQYERVKSVLDDVLRGESNGERFEIELSRPNGDYVIEFAISPIVDEDGSITGAVGISTDITERKRYEEQLNALHVSTRELTAATSREQVAEVVCDAANGVLNYNISGVLLYDESTDTLVPTAFTEEAQEMFGDIPPLPRGTGFSWEVFESGEPHLYDDFESSPHRFNPVAEIKEELVVPIPDHGVFFVGSVDEGTLADQRLTLAKVLASNTRAALDRVEREQLLRQRERELARQNEQLESFASAVSHDLQNPLNVAMGYLELAQEQFDSDELARVQVAHERMETIIQDVLALARSGQTVDEVEPLPLKRVVAEAWNTVATSSPEATLKIDGIAEVDAHHGRLRQLFENLLSNAIRHGGDDVTIRVGPLEARPGFYVEDDGPGIPPDERSRVFESGYTTSPEGTGFGLSVVISVVNAHGWDIDVSEGDGGGARFEITTETGR
ncbi:PAS domain S-box protein [Haloferax mediterranei ATCC 33500]|uniref:histidine kinase n=2 Tax=Haloferacaceae TaxID=1644056 RepID=I3R5T2_HALMT|nr:PAS domain S-box protein [Haloferax mediterranei]AFK19592.1 HTR-like protein [Haloferax mediterranei ATCC 33500]AHZ22984.1 chemotaxis protein CheY [Haloferax mediterranei ATCC 33500]ELZ99911.1 HTR-like protein [Haloferax mediterranei ATCC 33500]MDX5987667.1 PAS domain S-box protein [Haloferax mediterranei ATCC 33500]QCQ74151.1 PAS domain S-box protein [Haloferax mediterranei ATCC 33500]